MILFERERDAVSVYAALMSQDSDVPPPPVETEAPASPPLNEEDEAGDSERPAAPAPSVAAPSHVPPPPPPPTTREEVAYGFLMADANDLRVGDIIAAWKINGDIGVESNLHYGRVVFISPDEIRTHPSMADCSIVPTSGRSRLRVCARRVPSGPFVINPLPHLFPVDVNDGHVDAKLDRRMGAPSTMTLVQGHDPRWMKLAEAAADARATEHKAQVDGAAFNQADDDGNFPPNLFAEINNLKENAVKKAVEEVGGSYFAALVPPETPNDEVSRLVAARRSTWRARITTLLKPSERINSDEYSGAVFPSHDNDFCDGMPTDGAAAQLAEEQQRRHRKENEERKARHAEELAAAIEKKQGEATAAKTNEEYDQLPHNHDIIRKGNYDEMAVVPLDYERICAGDPGEFVVVVGADEKLFTSARPPPRLL